MSGLIAQVKGELLFIGDGTGFGIASMRIPDSEPAAKASDAGPAVRKAKPESRLRCLLRT